MFSCIRGKRSSLSPVLYSSLIPLSWKWVGVMARDPLFIMLCYRECLSLDEFLSDCTDILRARLLTRLGEGARIMWPGSTRGDYRKLESGFILRG